MNEILNGTVLDNIDEDDFNALHDVLFEINQEINWNSDTMPTLISMLPDEITSSILAWSLTDTEVRETIFVEVQQNQDKYIDYISTLVNDC